MRASRRHIRRPFRKRADSLEFIVFSHDLETCGNDFEHYYGSRQPLIEARVFRDVFDQSGKQAASGYWSSLPSRVEHRVLMGRGKSCSVGMLEKASWPVYGQYLLNKKIGEI